MSALLFLSSYPGQGKNIQQKMEKAIGRTSLLVSKKIAHLKRILLYRKTQVNTAILYVQREHELDELLSFNDLFEGIFLILILPSADDAIIAKGHRLRPRFLSYNDTEFEDIVAVLNHISQRGKEISDHGNTFQIT